MKVPRMEDPAGKFLGEVLATAETTIRFVRGIEAECAERGVDPMACTWAELLRLGIIPVHPGKGLQ